MYKNNLLFALICLPLLFNCTGHLKVEKYPRPSSTNNYIPVYSTGIVVKAINDRLLIEDFDTGSPAKAAGMQIGDRIAAINGKILPHEEFLKFMHMNRGENVHFMIKRQDQMLYFTIMPKLYFISPPSAHKIYELLVIDEQQVNLAIVVIDVRSNANKGSYSWQEYMRHHIERDIKNNILDNLPSQDNLSFVDGPLLADIIEEYKLNMTGLTSEDARAKIRNVAGATHLLAVTFVRNPKRINGRESCEDSVEASLIEIKSGAVLAIDQSTSPCR